jgi:hypothetical protein
MRENICVRVLGDVTVGMEVTVVIHGCESLGWVVCQILEKQAPFRLAVRPFITTP